MSWTIISDQTQKPSCALHHLKSSPFMKPWTRWAENNLAAEVVKWRYFLGLTILEIADALGLARRKVDRHWAFARAWLKTAIRTGLNM